MAMKINYRKPKAEEILVRDCHKGDCLILAHDLKYVEPDVFLVVDTDYSSNYYSGVKLNDGQFWALHMDTLVVKVAVEIFVESAHFGDVKDKIAGECVDGVKLAAKCCAIKP